MNRREQVLLTVFGFGLIALVMTVQGWGVLASRSGPGHPNRIASMAGSRPYAVFSLSIDPAADNSGAVTELINAINTANGNGVADTIVLRWRHST